MNLSLATEFTFYQKMIKTKKIMTVCSLAWKICIPDTFVSDWESTMLK